MYAYIYIPPALPTRHKRGSKILYSIRISMDYIMHVYKYIPPALPPRCRSGKDLRRPLRVVTYPVHAYTDVCMFTICIIYVCTCMHTYVYIRTHIGLCIYACSYVYGIT